MHHTSVLTYTCVMDGQTIGLIITIVAVVALLIGFGWLFIFGTRNEWPEGERKVGRAGGFTSHVIWSPAMSGRRVPLLARATAEAARATTQAWREHHGSDPPDSLHVVAAYVLTDEEFEDRIAKSMPWASPEKMQSYLTHTRRRLGHGPPMAVMRGSLQDHLMRTGQPAIHEYLHALGGLIYDRVHENAETWAEDDDVWQIEERAAELFT